MKVLDDTLISNELPIDDTDYEFSINTDIPGFSVTRKSNREVSFKKELLDVQNINKIVFNYTGSFLFYRSRWLHLRKPIFADLKFYSRNLLYLYIIQIILDKFFVFKN